MRTHIDARTHLGRNGEHFLSEIDEERESLLLPKTSEHTRFALGGESVGAAVCTSVGNGVGEFVLQLLDPGSLKLSMLHGIGRISCVLQ